MWAGLLVLWPYLLDHVGGWFEVLAAVEQIAPGWTSPRGVSWSWSYLASWYVVWFVAYCTRVELIMKIFAARDHKVARCSLPWTILLVMIFLGYVILYVGGAARLLVWDQISSPDQAFPSLVAMLLPPALAALALTGIAAAAMSTTDALLLASGAAVAHDILRKCIHEPRGVRKDEAYYLHVSRAAIVAVGILAFLGSLADIALILHIVSYAVGIVGATFFFPLLVGLTWRRVSKQAAIASSMGGAVSTALWTWWTLAGVQWATAIHPAIPGLGIAGILMLTVTFLTAPVGQEAVQKYFPESI
jgi:Na+/proline symporter